MRLLAGVTRPPVYHRTRGSSALLVLESAGRWFAITFGQGRHLLARDAYVHRFGLRVALNAADPARLRGAQARSFSGYALQTQRQVSRLSAVEALELDVERDLVTAIGGAVADSTLGIRIEGRQAVRLTAELEVSALARICERLLRESRKSGYRLNYPWIDNVQEVTDPARIAELDGEAARLLGSRRFAPFDLFPAELVAEQIVQYGTWPGWGGLKVVEPGELLLQRAVPHAMGGEEAAAAMRRCKLIGVDVDGQEVDRWSFWECLHCEIGGDGETLILDGGRWYVVASGLVRTVERFVDQLSPSGLDLPAALRTDDEDAYNRRAAASLGMACLDKQLIRLPGLSPIEPCDLLSAQGHFVHVKRRKGGSGPLSHLYSQALVSCECLREEREFRDQLRGKLRAGHAQISQLIGEPPDPASLPVVLGLITSSRTAGHAARQLPFFSKVALRQAVRRLRAMSFQVYVDEIPTEL